MNNSEQPNPSVTLFLDATHQSKITAKLLRDLGVSVEVHKRYYLPTEADPVWIADCTQRGWAIISGDKGIEYDGVNRQAVVQSKAKVFILADTTSRGIEWAASLVMARHRILRIVEENEGPFYCTIEKGKDDHVGSLRFLEGGHPITKSLSFIETQVAVPDSKPVLQDEVPENSPKQSEMFKKI